VLGGLGQLGAAGVAIGLLLAYFSTQSLLARQKYFWQAGANILGNSLRLILLLVTPLPALTVFFLGTLGTFAVGLPNILGNIRKFSWDLGFTKEVWRFCLPAAGSYSLTSISAKLDIPILYYFAGPMAVGLYSSAQKLTSVLAQIAGALDNVFAPKFAAKEKKAFGEYLILGALGVLGVLGIIPIAGVLLSIIYGAKYVSAQTVLTIFLMSYLPFFLSGPFLGKILYYYGKAKWFLGISIANSLINLISLIVLGGLFKENGAAVALVITNTTALIMYVFVYSLLVNKGR
jgi:O-antigen/teichoic acid export membrane protein